MDFLKILLMMIFSKIIFLDQINFSRIHLMEILVKDFKVYLKVYHLKLLLRMVKKSK